MIIEAKAVIGLLVTNLLVAQLPLPQTPTVDASKVTLEVALVAALGFLWRALEAARKEAKEERDTAAKRLAEALAAKDATIEKKDAQILQVVTEFTRTSVSVLDAVKELRGSVEEKK